MLERHPIDVACYAGSRADECPRRFSHHGQTVEIAEILDRWYEGGVDPRTPIVDYFKVRGDDDTTYLLRHTRKADAWYLVRKP